MSLKNPMKSRKSMKLKGIFQIFTFRRNSCPKKANLKMILLKSRVRKRKFVVRRISKLFSKRKKMKKKMTMMICLKKIILLRNVWLFKIKSKWIPLLTIDWCNNIHFNQTHNFLLNPYPYNHNNKNLSWINLLLTIVYVKR